MRRFPVRFIGPESFVHNPSLADFIITTSGFEFSVHTGAASDVVPKFVSPSDPAAQWTGAHKGPAFFAYSDNYLIDVKFGVIVMSRLPAPFARPRSAQQRP